MVGSACVIVSNGHYKASFIMYSGPEKDRL